MKAVPGATPLAALDAVVFDTETTGLDTTKARIIEIGGIRIDAGQLGEETFSELVDPGQPIPPASTNVHGITDAMVSGQKTFAAALAAFTVFHRGRVLVGHSIGFDFAVLAREAERTGLKYTRPRSLCIRVLGQIANPHLPDHSLDMLAGWLGVTVTDRHRALGDARATADVFLAMVPALAKKGIRTLAEAERASAAMTREIERHQRAGWADPVVRPGEAAAAGRVDPYAYRHRVRDVMSSPPICVAAATTVKQVIDLMAERKISAVFISADGAPGGHARDYGVVTERHMLRIVSERGADAFSLPIGPLASQPLVGVEADAFVYRAVARMNRLKLRHLAVNSDTGLLQGIVTSRDLLKLRASAAIALDDAIDVSLSAAEMGRAFAQVPDMAQSLMDEGLEAAFVAEIVSEEIRAMTRRAAILAEARMAAAGRGGPPCAYAVLVLGSAGRGESLLAPDQDNAIVFATGDPDGPEDRWFAELGEHVASILDDSGVPLCKGGVMAKNARFRGSLAAWSERIAHWVSRSSPEDLLDVDIFYDMRPVHGDIALGDRLFETAYELGKGSIAFAKLMGVKVEDTPNPFTFFGGIRTDEKGRIDLKLHGLFPIVTAARALAIRHGVAERSTRKRLVQASGQGFGGEKRIERVLEARATLLSLVLKQQRRDIAHGLPATNHVEVAALNADETARLKAALTEVSGLPDLVKDLMFASN